MNGIFSALLGVFNADGDINEDGVRALVRHNIDKCGIDGLYVNGSTGETFLMTMEMRKKVLRTVADEAKGQVSLIAHVGGICLDDVNELSKEAADLGYDAISAVTPFYYKFTPDELRLYYTNIAEKSALPLIAYYIPSLTGVTMSIDNLCSILDTPNVSGLKFTSNDFFVLERLRTARPEKLIFSGFDEMLLPMTVLGTNGAIGSTYNIIVARTFFRSTIPDELLEAAKIDGCGNGRFFVQIALPLSKPILAVLALWVGVGRWNSYFTEMLYLRSVEKYPLSLFLRQILWRVQAMKELLTNNREGVEITSGMLEQAKLASIMQYVVIIFASAPLLAVYPFIQKYFTKGVMIGSVKG